MLPGLAVSVSQPRPLSLLQAVDAGVGPGRGDDVDVAGLPLQHAVIRLNAHTE